MEGKYIVFHEFGPPENVLQIETKKVIQPNKNEVLVRMLARPINPSDLIPIRGSYSHRIKLPNIPGYEGVGVVVAVGVGVSKELIGKRVLPLRGEGTWQQYVRASVDWAVVIPDTIDNITAAQMYINPLTALVVCTEVLQLKRDDVLVVNACGSSIGRIIAQLAKVIGFRLIAVTRNYHHTTDLLNLGADVVIDTSKESLQEAVANYTNGRGANAAIDSIGGVQGTNLAQCVRPNGDFLTIGLLSGEQINWRDIVHRNSIKANLFHLRHWNASVTPENLDFTFKQIMTLIQQEQLSLMPSNYIFPLERVHEAVRITEKTQGKIFLMDE